MVAMVGNDVVDLRDRSVATGPRHPRFDARVFAPSEHRALRESDEANPLRWAFWAAKEAAYKVAKKLDDAAIWSPVRFVVHIDASGAGRVEHEGRDISVRVEKDAERVHAVACDTEASLSRVRARVAELPAADANPSATVRALAREDLAGVLERGAELLEIARRGRIPVLRVDGEDAPLDLSLSHHGRFVAWATEHRTVAGFAGGEAFEGSEIITWPADVLIPAALEDAIDEENADKVQAQIIVEAANAPTTPAADTILHNKGVVIVPDILANAGGVTVSYFEWAQNIQQFRWELDRVNAELEKRMRLAYEAVRIIAREKDTDLRTAAFVLAIQRVGRAAVSRRSLRETIDFG